MADRTINIWLNGIVSVSQTETIDFIRSGDPYSQPGYYFYSYGVSGSDIRPQGAPEDSTGWVYLGSSITSPTYKFFKGVNVTFPTKGTYNISTVYYDPAMPSSTMAGSMYIKCVDTCQKMTFNGKELQVKSAICDVYGNSIPSTYATKAELAGKVSKTGNEEISGTKVFKSPVKFQITSGTDLGTIKVQNRGSPIGNTLEINSANALLLQYYGGSCLAAFGEEVYVGNNTVDLELLSASRPTLTVEDASESMAYLSDIPNDPEHTSNKVTSIGGGSTDIQYPSAKCVYDNLVTKQDVLTSGTNIKTINNTSVLGSGNVDITDVFIVQYHSTPHADILAAYNNNKLCLMFKDNAIYVAVQVTTAYAKFISAEESKNRVILVTHSGGSDSWYFSSYFLQIENCVTTISASSTDFQYPSAKCVYDNLATKQKTITYGTSDPSGGSDGDIYIKYEE